MSERALELLPDEIHLLETEIVPQYLSLFLPLVLEGLRKRRDEGQASVAQFGWPVLALENAINEQLRPSRFVHLPSSQESAGERASERDHGTTTTIASEPPSFSGEEAPKNFSHAVVFHPSFFPYGRKPLLSRLRRMVEPGGQVIMAVPLRGSFVELFDMLREYAVRKDSVNLSSAIDRAAQGLPNPEALSGELENNGFDDVEVSVELLRIPFSGGREFCESSFARILLFRELETLFGTEPFVDDSRVDGITIEDGLDYARRALATYWSEGSFEITVNIGCATGVRSKD